MRIELRCFVKRSTIYTYKTTMPTGIILLTHECVRKVYAAKVSDELIEVHQKGLEAWIRN